MYRLINRCSRISDSNLLIVRARHGKHRLWYFIPFRAVCQDFWHGIWPRDCRV